MHCPNCGGELNWDQRFAHLVVCGYCSSAVVVDEAAARVAGKMNVLALPAGPLFVGGRGTVHSKRFEVVGRVRYGYGKGCWDEWFLAFEDGATAWISQDEGEYALEKAQRLDALPDEIRAAVPGDTVRLGNRRFHVDERDVAECEGGEGQLPFEVVAGERVEYLDLRDETGSTASVELEEEGARVFFGRRIPERSLVMDLTAEEAGKTPAPSAAGGGRLVRDTRRAVDLKCYACGHPLPEVQSGDATIECRACGTVADLSTPRIECANCHESIPVFGGDEAGSTVCRFCHAQLDLESGTPALLEVLKERKRDGPRVPLELGQRCRLAGAQWQLVGHLRMREADEDGVYWADEFLLHSPTAGYRWLTTENGHWSLECEVHPTALGKNPRRLRQKSKFSAAGRTWTVFEKNTNGAAITWVDGELPWVAREGDRAGYVDCISPPYMLTAEWTETELEWFQAEYLPREEVATAFGVPVSGLPRAVGVAPHEPFERTPFRSAALRVMPVFAALLLALLLLDGCASGDAVATFQVAPAQYDEEYVTGPFTIRGRGSVCSLGFYAPVDNEWVWLSGGVVDSQDRVLVPFTAQISYYHGYEGGESWSEGSKRDDVVLKLEEPGEYRLVLSGEGGTGETAAAVAPRTVTITVREGVVLSRYYVLLLVLAGAWTFFELLRGALFEGRRWAPVLED